LQGVLGLVIAGNDGVVHKSTLDVRILAAIKQQRSQQQQQHCT
jgi:hypothetical protein